MEYADGTDVMDASSVAVDTEIQDSRLDARDEDLMRGVGGGRRRSAALSWRRCGMAGGGSGAVSQTAAAGGSPSARSAWTAPVVGMAQKGAAWPRETDSRMTLLSRRVVVVVVRVRVVVVVVVRWGAMRGRC
jgi:hypothetical protein